jgi:hypothetical protein
VASGHQLSLKPLLSIHQLARRPIDRGFELIAAGLARPRVTNAVIRNMLGPLGCDQNRTALRALIAWIALHWPLPKTLSVAVDGHPKIKGQWRDKDSTSTMFRLNLRQTRPYDFLNWAKSEQGAA